MRFRESKRSARWAELRRKLETNSTALRRIRQLGDWSRSLSVAVRAGKSDTPGIDGRVSSPFESACRFWESELRRIGSGDDYPITTLTTIAPTGPIRAGERKTTNLPRESIRSDIDHLDSLLWMIEINHTSILWPRGNSRRPEKEFCDACPVETTRREHHHW